MYHFLYIFIYLGEYFLICRKVPAKLIIEGTFACERKIPEKAYNERGNKMKKLLTLILILTLALSIAVPALAYTSYVPSTASPCVLDIFLVDYNDALFGPSVSTPASNRGYTRNEIVAAVAQVTVDANIDITDYYHELKFGGENISLNVADNQINAANFAMLRDTLNTTQVNWTRFYDWHSGDNEIVKVFHAADTLPVSTKKVTYGFLFYGKVLSDYAEMYVELSRGSVFSALNTWNSVTPDYLRPDTSSRPAGGVFLNATVLNGTPTQFMVLNSDFIVYTTGNDGTARHYYVSDHPSGNTLPTLLFEIKVDSKNAANEVTYWHTGTPYTLYMTAGGDVVISNIATGQILDYGKATYNSVLVSFNSYFEDLGLALANRSNKMTHSFWQSVAGSLNTKETVSIDPWVPYVQIPEVEVVTPPKTGSAASILGFTFIALAGLAAVVMKKARAK